MYQRQAWFSVDQQYWPKVGYGLLSIAAPFAQLATCPDGPHHQLLPYGGVIRTCKKAIRQINQGFYGVGLPHMSVENMIKCSDKLLMHYGCNTSIGLKLQASMEALIIELGMSLQPLGVKYKTHSAWVTNSWLKFLWEKIDIFNLTVEVNNEDLEQPREKNQWLM